MWCLRSLVILDFDVFFGISVLLSHYKSVLTSKHSYARRASGIESTQLGCVRFSICFSWHPSVACMLYLDMLRQVDEVARKHFPGTESALERPLLFSSWLSKVP